MPTTYEYKVRDRAGNLVSGQLIGDSEGLVMTKLREMGMTPIEVKKAKAGLKMEINLRPGHVKMKDLAVFSRQFATMVNSGLPILRALSILGDQTENKELQKVLVQVRLDVEQGASLSGAMDKHPKAFSDLYVAMVKAGETGGVLDNVLLRLADNIEKEVELRRKVKSAMTYPVVVVMLVGLIMSAMLLFVVPQFKSIYAQLGGTLPVPTQILLTASNAVRTYWYVFALFFFGVSFGFRRYKKTDRGRAQVDAVKLKVPVFGSLFHKTALARFSSTLGMLLRSGVPILQALDIVADTVNNKVISRAVGDVQGAVREGESMAKPLSKHGVFPPMVVQMLAVGEETGAVDTMLDKVADFYNSEVSASVDALTSLIEPLMIAIVGGAVGAAVIALYMPMFNIIKLIK
ncbi:MAG: type II secretion system F family protein [Actinobacteria bacterium]|nr:MAG: type II secretion system F family protein [Actinomycetota bacterium]